MMTRRLFAIILTGLTVVALNACSKEAPPAGGSTATTSAGTSDQPAAAPAAKPIPHACDLLTVKDAEAVMGPGARLVRDSSDTCDLATASELGPTISVKIEELSDTWDGGDTMAAMDKDVKKLPDIGDGGYSYMGGSIAFKKGKAEVSVITSNYRNGPLSKIDAARLVATKVAAAM
jgi:hypothetical protein